MKSWKTTVIGIAVVILMALGPVLEAYLPIKGLNWNVLTTTISGILAGAGLVLAKDRDSHSTAEQVKAATEVAKIDKQ